MATKRKTTKRKSTPKKRVGAIHHYHTPKKTATRRRSTKKIGAIGTTGEILLGAVGGSIATRIIQANIPKPTGSFDYRPYTGLVVGAAAEYFGKKNLLIRSMAIGAIVEGSRSIIADKYIPSLTSAKLKGLPYTTAHVGRKKVKKMMGLKNSLAGNRRMIGATSTPNALAGNMSVFGYDGF